MNKSFISLPKEFDNIFFRQIVNSINELLQKRKKLKQLPTNASQEDIIRAINEIIKCLE